jgi:hypothetical protein
MFAANQKNMRRFIYLLLFLPLAGFSQAIKLSGQLQDEKHLPVPYATMTLKNQPDSLVFKSTLADKNGQFVFNEISKGNYILQVSAVGFKSHLQKIKLSADAVLPVIILKDELAQLGEVTIAAKKPTVTRKIDRVEFNVENTALSSTNAWEIVKRAPGVQSGGGGLSIRGSKGILVTINDKKVYLSGDELKAYLEGTNGGDVKSVEVITNPPAKYEASGSAVINIKLKKNTQAGYKGSLGGSYVQGIYVKGNVSTSQYYKTEKLSLYGSYTFGTGVYYNEIKEVTRYTAGQQTWEDELKRKNYRDAEHTYRAALDYAIDSLNTLSLGTDGYIARKNHALYNVPTQIYNQSHALLSYFETQNKRLAPNSNHAYNLGYEHLFSTKEKITLRADYTNYHSEADQDVRTAYYLVNPRNTRFTTDNTQHIRLFSTQLDYSKQSKLFDLETGFKYSHVKAANGVDFRRDTLGNLASDPGLSNTFAYDESVSAAYFSLNKDLKSWSLKAGLRGEYTAISSRSVSPSELNSQSYFNLFPTLFIQDKLSPDHQLGFSYGKRISRPQYSYLNPSRSYFSPNSYLVGDARLKPAMTDQFSLNYDYKENYHAQLYYISERKPTIQLPFQDNATNTLIQKVTNIPGNHYYGIDLSTSLQPAAWWSVDVQAGPGHVESSFGLADGTVLHNRAFTVNGNLDNQLTVNKKAGFTAGISFSFNTAGVQGPARVSGTSSLGFSARKKLWQNRAEISLLVSDSYRGEKMKVSSDYAEQHNYFTYYGDSQNLRVSFKYNLGNTGLKAKAAKEKTEEQNRL